MSAALELDVRLTAGSFALAVQWRTDEPSLGLFGPSGAGKTTLLEIVAGTRRGAQGVVRVGGRTWLDTAAGVALPPETRGVGWVPQDLLLFPHRDVLGNLLAGRRRALRAGRAAIDPERVIEVLELRGLERRPVDALSGGERRRVALGRALCSGPDLLLLDEPLAALDTALRDRVAGYLLRVRRTFALPTILVSHDVTETKLLSREVAILRAGRVVRRGRPDEVFLAPDVFPAALHEGFENLVSGRVDGVEEGAARVVVDGGVALVVPAGTMSAGEVTVGLRAEDLIVAVERPTGLSAQNVVEGVVREVRGEAERVLVVVEVGAARLPLAATITPRARARLGLEAGRRAFLVWKANACRVWA